MQAPGPGNMPGHGANLNTRNSQNVGGINCDISKAGGVDIDTPGSSSSKGVRNSGSSGASPSSNAMAVKSYASTAKKAVRVEGKASDIRRLADKSRSYLLDTLPPTGMPMFMKKKFLYLYLDDHAIIKQYWVSALNTTSQSPVDS